MSYILFAVLLYLLSVRQKVAKNSAQNKISHNSLLLASRKRHPSVGCGAEAHSFGELKLPSSQTLLARNGTIEGSSLPFRRSGTRAVQHYKQKNNAAALQTFLALPLNVNGLQL